MVGAVIVRLKLLSNDQTNLALLSPPLQRRVVLLFPSHNQNERKVRDMASYDIQAVIFDNHVEGSLPKGLAKQVGLDILTRLVAPKPSQ